MHANLRTCQNLENESEWEGLITTSTNFLSHLQPLLLIRLVLIHNPCIFNASNTESKEKNDPHPGSF